MNVALIIMYASMFVFLLPPFRQYKRTYFYFFLLLALSDPVAKLLKELFGVYQAKVHIIFSILSLISVQNFENKKKLIKLAAPIVLIIAIGLSFMDIHNKGNIDLIRIVMGFLHVGIFFIFVKKSVVFLREYMGINFFQIMLILYESTIILKFFIYVLNLPKGMIFFFITGAFELFLGLFFTIFREDSPKLILYIKDKVKEVPD